MKKILKFANGFTSITTSDRLAIKPFSDAVPTEVIDVSNATNEEFEKIKENHNDKKLIDKIKKRK